MKCVIGSKGEGTGTYLASEQITQNVPIQLASSLSSDEEHPSLHSSYSGVRHHCRSHQLMISQDEILERQDPGKIVENGTRTPY